MAKKERLIKVVIVNKFGPFDKDITGKSLWQLGRYLQSQQCNVTYICVRESVKSNAPLVTIDETADVKYVPRIDFGNSALARLCSSMLECKLLFWRTLFTSADVRIIMSAPPLLNWFGIWLRKLRKRPTIFWTMDLYPEAFLASGLVSAKGLPYRFLEKIIYKNPPNALITLGGQQLHFLQQKYSVKIPSIVLPCGIKQVIPSFERPDWIKEDDEGKIKFCYTGNLGEAHDENFLMAFAQTLDADKFKLYINLYGTKAEKVLQQIEALPVVQKIGFLKHEQMHHIDIHIASLQSKWDHICVPSKAVSAICAGAVLLLNCSNQCDAWHMFKEAAYWIEQQDSGNYSVQINNLLSAIYPAGIQQKKEAAALLAKSLQLQQDKAFSEIALFIRNRGSK